MSDILPLLGVYVKYPLPTEQGTCAMATAISEKMGGPHVKDSLSPLAWTKPLSLSCLCPYCNKWNNSRESLLNHIQFHYRMVLVCPICSGCGLNQWKTVEGHVKKCAAARPNVAERIIMPCELHWRKLDPPLKNDTRAVAMEVTYTLQVWPDAPNDEEATH